MHKSDCKMQTRIKSTFFIPTALPGIYSRKSTINFQKKPKCKVAWLTVFVVLFCRQMLTKSATLGMTQKYWAHSGNSVGSESCLKTSSFALGQR